MSNPETRAAGPQLRRILLGVALGLLATLCALILRPLLAPIVWAAILAYASWPVYRWLQIRLRCSKTPAALVVPVLWLLILMQRELADAYTTLTAFVSQGPHTLPGVIRGLPWLGDFLQNELDRYTRDPTALGREALGALQRWSTELTGMLGDIGRNIAKLLMAMVTLFFFYRDGDTVIQQAEFVVRRFMGNHVNPYINTAGKMTRAVLYGLLITAFSQGLMAGIGYRVAGIQGPVLLGVLTGVLSVIPAIGTAIVWVPLSVWLIMTGPLWKGMLLFAWGFVLVHPIDNVLRPILISNVTRVPFLLVLFGAIGGLAAFGLVGVFVGPALLGVAMAIWREWATPADPLDEGRLTDSPLSNPDFQPEAPECTSKNAQMTPAKKAG